MAEKYRLGVMAVVPFWSQSDNMNLDSNYAYLRVILPEFEKRTEDTIFLLFFPDPKVGADKWIYTPDGLRSDRIRLVNWGYDTQMSTSISGFDPNRWHEIEKNFGPNIYWLNQVEMGSQIYGGYWKSYTLSCRPTLIAQHHYIIHRSLPGVYDSFFTRQWLQIGGSIASDKVVCNSEHCKKMMIEAFGEYLSEERLNKLLDKTSVLPFGFVSADTPESSLATPASEPTFIYNHRFEAYKQPKLTWDAFNQLKEMGYKFKVWITMASSQMITGAKNFWFDEDAYQATRPAYLQKLASTPLINTINSLHETFCISMMDCLMIGHLMVAPKAITFPELVPPDYPYLFKNQKEQIEMLAYILENFEQEYNKWHPILRAFVRKKFALEDYVDAYLELIDATERTHSNVMKENTKLHFDDTLGRLAVGKTISLRSLFGNYHSLSKLGTQAFTPARLIREVLRQYPDVRLYWDSGVVFKKE